MRVSAAETSLLPQRDAIDGQCARLRSIPRRFLASFTSTGPFVLVEGIALDVDLPGGLLPDGIAFDDVGRFDHRLLVTATAQNETVLFALDCLGAVTTLTAHAPRMEGGIAVAPDSFGSFAGDLVAPDEQSGRIFAIDPAGHATTLAKSGLPSGGDIGVESAGFVPPAFGPSVVAYVADRRSPGNPHPGTDSILELSGTDLARASVHSGDLLMASEGGAQTIVVQ